MWGVDILKRKRVVLERSMQSAVVSWRRQEVIRVNEFVEKGEELKLNQGATESRISCDRIMSHCHQCVNGEFLSALVVISLKFFGVVAAKRPPCVAANMSGMTSLVVERRCCSAADQLHRTNPCHLHACAHFSLLC